VLNKDLFQWSEVSRGTGHDADDLAAGAANTDKSEESVDADDGFDYDMQKYFSRTQYGPNGEDI
jgi:hypothetical protein